LSGRNFKGGGSTDSDCRCFASVYASTLDSVEIVIAGGDEVSRPEGPRAQVGVFRRRVS